jgi:hypothetical protein
MTKQIKLWKNLIKCQETTAEGNFCEKRNYMDAIKANSGRYSGRCRNQFSYSDYGTTMYSDKIVFASARDTGSLGHRRHTWTGQPFTKLYVSM